jgi:hypothetical protein
MTHDSQRNMKAARSAKIKVEGPVFRRHFHTQKRHFESYLIAYY